LTSSSQYSEDALAQKTTADYLERQLGWQSVYAFNSEDFGPDSLLGRASEKEVVLTRFLREALVRLNPGLPPSAYDDAVRIVCAESASQSLLTINREKYNFICDGVRVGFKTDKGERKTARLRLIDFDASENNHFLCVRELWIKGALYRRRADIVGFVNGLPLLFMELKNVHKNIETAYRQNFSDYKDTIPHLFHHNAFVVLGNGVEAKIGAFSSPFVFFNEWKRLAEEDEGAVDMESLLKGVCAKHNFNDLLENFILFDDSSGEARKIMAKNHQFLGVNKAVNAVSRRKELSGKLGVFWHTQGAGKSYSLNP
jgi:type I restriction enzyme R subunit